MASLGYKTFPSIQMISILLTLTKIKYNIGYAYLLIATIDSLNGVGVIVAVKEEIKGSEARGNTLYTGFSMPRGCSVSQVPLMSCRNPVKGIVLEINKDIQFSAKIAVKYLISNYSIQSFFGPFLSVYIYDGDKNVNHING